MNEKKGLPCQRAMQFWICSQHLEEEEHPCLHANVPKMGGMANILE